MASLTRLLYSPFFQNKFVLYGSLLLVLLSILRHIANRKFNAIILMALIGLLMSYFSKNMIIVLLTAFVAVLVLEMTGVRGAIEGMENKGDSDEEKDDDKEKDAENDDDESKEKDGEKESMDEQKPVAENKKEKNTKPSSEGKKEGNTGQTVVNTHKESEKKQKQGMTKLSPASYDGKEHDDGGSGSSGNRIDYASTLEQAYDNIENIIGEDGVRGLTDQTKSLMNQQKQLMDNMKDMGPLLKSAEGFMKQITGNGGIGGITEMLKGFATPGGK